MAKTSRVPRRKTSRAAPPMRPNTGRDLVERAVSILKERSLTDWLRRMSAAQRAVWDRKTEDERETLLSLMYPINEQALLPVLVEIQPIAITLRIQKYTEQQRNDFVRTAAGPALKAVIDEQRQELNKPIEDYLKSDEGRAEIKEIAGDQFVRGVSGGGPLPAIKEITERMRNDRIDRALWGLYVVPEDVPQAAAQETIRVRALAGRLLGDLTTPPEKQREAIFGGYAPAAQAPGSVNEQREERLRRQLTTPYVPDPFEDLVERPIDELMEPEKTFEMEVTTSEGKGKRGKRAKTSRKVTIEYGKGFNIEAFRKMELAKIRTPLESRTLKETQEKIDEADELRKDITRRKAEWNTFSRKLNEQLSNPVLPALEREQLRGYAQSVLAQVSEEISGAQQALDILQADIDRELLFRERDYSPTDLYEAIDPYRPQRAGKAQLPKATFSYEPTPTVVVDEETSDPNAPVALRETDPETGQPVIRVVNPTKRKEMVFRYLGGRETFKDIEELSETGLNYIDELFEGDEKIAFLETIGANLIGSADPETLRTQIEMLDDMVESGLLSVEKAESAKDLLKQRNATARRTKKQIEDDYKYVAKVKEFAKVRRRVLGEQQGYPQTGELTLAEIGLAMLRRPKRVERAASVEFTRAIRALKKRTRRLDEFGNPRFYDEDIVDADGNPIVAGFTTKTAGAPLYSGSLARPRMRVRGTSVADKWFQRLKAVERDYERAIERGGIRRPAEDRGRRSNAKQYFAALVNDYENYSKSEKATSFKAALSSARIDKERNAPRDLLRIRDLMAEFGFKLPEWSSARVRMTLRPLQEGGVTFEELAGRGEEAVEPERLSAAEWQREYGYPKPPKRTQAELTRAGRMRKADEEGLQIRQLADPARFEAEKDEIEELVDRNRITKEEGATRLEKLEKEHKGAQRLLAILEERVREYRAKRRPEGEEESEQEARITNRHIGMAYLEYLEELRVKQEAKESKK